MLRNEICAMFRSDQQGPRDQMISYPKPSRSWEVISTDLMCPLPRSTNSNAYILVVSDYLSKFSLVLPPRKATTPAIVRRMEEEIFSVFGVPRLVMCDNDPSTGIQNSKN